MVWYGLNWSLELYQQACARLHRQGQTKPVLNYHLIAKNTIDETVYAVLRRKDAGQEALLAALKARLVMSNQQQVVDDVA
jgi:SNF2 family DNA or RNA helicase